MAERNNPSPYRIDIGKVAYDISGSWSICWFDRLRCRPPYLKPTVQACYYSGTFRHSSNVHLAQRATRPLMAPVVALSAFKRSGDSNKSDLILVSHPCTSESRNLLRLPPTTQAAKPPDFETLHLQRRAIALEAAVLLIIPVLNTRGFRVIILVQHAKEH